MASDLNLEHPALLHIAVSVHHCAECGRTGSFQTILIW